MLANCMLFATAVVIRKGSGVLTQSASRHVSVSVPVGRPAEAMASTLLRRLAEMGDR